MKRRITRNMAEIINGKELAKKVRENLKRME